MTSAQQSKEGRLLNSVGLFLLQKCVSQSFSVVSVMLYKKLLSEMELFIIVANLLFYTDSFVQSSYVNKTFGDCTYPATGLPEFACGKTCLTTIISVHVKFKV